MMIYVDMYSYLYYYTFFLFIENDAPCINMDWQDAEQDGKRMDWFDWVFKY